MDLNYILSQVCVILAVGFLGTTYLIKDKKIILFLSILTALLYGIQYLLLGAMAGFYMDLVSIVRSMWFYINAKNKKKNSIFVLIGLYIIAIVFGVLSFKDIFSIFPMIATMLYTYSIWQDDVKVYRLLAIPVSISWITYNVYSKTLFGIITESVLLIIEIVGVIKLKKIKKD